MTRSRQASANGVASTEEIRANIERTRQQINRTISEIEHRLHPDRMKAVAQARVMAATEPWRLDPMGQMEMLGRDFLTRIREAAWMSPIGLGLAAVAAGFLLGRRLR